MDLLAEYKECLCRIARIQDETRDNKARALNLKSDLTKAEERVNALKIQMHTASESQINQKLQQMISEKRNELMGEIDLTHTEIERINSEASEAKQKVINQISIKQYKSELEMISRAGKVLSRGESVIHKEIPPEILMNVQSAVMQDSVQYDIPQLIMLVDKNLDSLPFVSDNSLFKLVIDYVLLDVKTFEKLGPRMRLFIYLLWCVTFSLVLIYLPIFFIMPYIGIMLNSLMSNSKYTRKLIALCYPYLVLERSISDLRKDLDKRVDIMRGQRFRQIDAKKAEMLKDLETKSQQLQDRLETVSSETKNSLSSEDIIAKVKSDFQSRIDYEMDQCKNITTALKRIDKYNESNASQLELALSRKEDLKQKVYDYYLNPTTPGASKLLTTSFFLGMDDSEELIEFDYKGETTLVVYKGENNSVNTPLITMMLMQLLANMSIVSLQLAITDIRNACIGYAQFSPSKLSNRIRLCATDEAVSEIIELFHTELLTRTSTILTQAPNIQEFNQQMLQRKSLTREYYILFIQDPDPKLLGSQKFLQLCRSGPVVGIIPIIFISHLAVSSMRSENAQILIPLIEFFECVRNNTFTFNGSTQDINSDLASANQIIDDLRRSLLK